VAAGIITAATLAVGCEFYPSPSEDAVYYFLAGARVDGKVRRCWPAGQAYVERVLKADARLRQELARLFDLEVDALWAEDDPRWREADVLDEHIAELTQQVEAGAAKRQKILDELSEAIDELPADLPLATPEARDPFKARVWQALATDGEDLRQHVSWLDETAAARLRLFKRVQECAEHFADDEIGLRFGDENCQQDVDQLYDDLRKRLQDRREAFLVFAEQRLGEVRGSLKSVDKRDERNEYQYLIDHRGYLRGKLETISKELDERIQAAEKKLEAYADGKVELTQPEAEFLQREAARLRVASVAHAERRLKAIGRSLEAVDRQKQRDEHEYLAKRRDFLRDKLEAMPKQLDEIVKAVEEKLESHAAGTVELTQERASFLEQRVERIKAEHAELKQLIDAALTGTGTGASQPPGP